MSISKRETGNVVIFEAPTGGVVAFCTQQACYVSPVCTPGVKSDVLTLMPKELTLEESLTQADFLELLAQKSR